MKAQPVEPLAVLQSRGNHGRDGVAGWKALGLGRIDRAAVDAHAQGAIVLGGLVRNKGYFVGDRLVLFVVIEVPGIVAYFLHVWGHTADQPIVLLQIHGQRHVNSRGDVGEGLHIFFAIDGNADDVRPGLG